MCDHLPGSCGQGNIKEGFSAFNTLNNVCVRLPFFGRYHRGDKLGQRGADGYDSQTDLTSGKIGRIEGGIMIALYAADVVFAILR
mgnify:CR=1 FL=1